MVINLKIHTNEIKRRLYANEASSYEELPKAVAFPENTEDIIELVRYAREQNLPITARGAGTSLAGQTTGGGLAIDAGRYMNRILNIDTSNKSAHVQPGVIRDTLNREADQYNLLFGPDTATTSRCMLGGMIGNNSRSEEHTSELQSRFDLVCRLLL